MGRGWFTVLLAAVLVACAPDIEDAARAVSTTGPLNGSFVIRLGAKLDPFSVTSRSVQVTDAAGRPLAARVLPCDEGLSVELVVDAALLQRKPEGLLVRLSGGASGHPLLRTDGRPRPRSEVVSIALEPRLAERAGGGLRLTNLPDGEVPFEVDPAGVLRLEFEGVIDPARTGPQACPLFPEVRGARLAPIFPPFDWRIVGGRTQVDLRLEAWTGSLLLVTRRLALRALDGAAVEPRVEREVVQG